jgi:hypothetical protein
MYGLQDGLDAIKLEDEPTLIVIPEAVQLSPAEYTTLAQAVLHTAEVSHLKAVMEIRQEIIDAGFSPSAELATPADLSRAQVHLSDHRLNEPDD